MHLLHINNVIVHFEKNIKMKNMFSIMSILLFGVATQAICTWAFNIESSKFFNALSIPFQGRSGNMIRAFSGYPLRSELSSDQYPVQIQKKENMAINALESLLERQRKEVKETEALIRELSQKNETKSDLSIDGRATNASDIVASIYSGFDYGFVSRSDGCRSDLIGGFDLSSKDGNSESYAPPANILSLGSQQFMRNLNAMMGEYKDEEDISLSPTQKSFQKKLKSLTLSTEAIWERERSRGVIVAPWIIKLPYFVLCYFLDVVFKDSYVFSRFFLLETVARMPYFSYITMLHLYETLGFWRRSSDIKRIHFAEEWNEFHHLLIMESLGGDQSWWVRFMAQHSAILYFTGLTILWAISPTLAYKFSELLETHAVDTYGQLVDENEELLKKLPPSVAAIEYYSLGISDPLFGEYQTSSISNGEVRVLYFSSVYLTTCLSLH
jgi:ubiquinol oxidase